MLSNRGIKVRSCHALLTKNEGTTKNIDVLDGERPKQSNYTKMAAVGVLYYHACHLVAKGNLLFLLEWHSNHASTVDRRNH